MGGLIGSIIIGCLAGFCAGKLMRGGGFGFLVNLLLGVFGGLVGERLFSLIGFSWGTSSDLIARLGTAIVGAVVILWIAAKLKK